METKGKVKLSKEKFAVAPHIDSFNFFLEKGLDLIPEYLDTYEVEAGTEKLRYSVEKIVIGNIRTREIASGSMKSARLYPRECRRAGISYDAPCTLKIAFEVLPRSRHESLSSRNEVNSSSSGEENEEESYSNEEVEESPTPVDGRSKFYIEKSVGRIPIMVGSNKCNIMRCTESQMMEHGEEPREAGGFFISNGLEKVVRMLVAQRCNYPMAQSRNAYSKSGPSFSDHCVTMRCTREDQSSTSIFLHYLNNGSISLRFTILKRSYFLPLVIVMRALIDVSDREIFLEITGSELGNNQFMVEQVQAMLREAKSIPYFSRREALSYIGSNFRPVLTAVYDSHTDEEVGMILLKRYICVHLNDPRSKFRLLAHMANKLYHLANGSIIQDNADSPAFQEVLQVGHLFVMIMKEKIQDYLEFFETLVKRDIAYQLIHNVKEERRVNLNSQVYIKGVLSRMIDIGKKLSYFVTTGNLISKSGLDLRQTSGFAIVAEKINYMRYISHFRCIHRGQFFTEMRTTSVRRLLPDSWGFLCPVETPDGSPCGLLNHLTEHCAVSTIDSKIMDLTLLKALLSDMGMTSLPAQSIGATKGTDVPVVVDGEVVGWIQSVLLPVLEYRLRKLKISQKHPEAIPYSLEIVVQSPGQHRQPSVYLFSGLSRLLRPVFNLHLKKEELIGSMEQLHLEIAVRESEVLTQPTIPTMPFGGFSHVEISPKRILSVVASLTPFSDNNQSPRNMYQCQMLKQTMGIPSLSLKYRTDNKMYLLQSPQSPIVRNKGHDEYSLDDYLTGTNALVAVLSYTGYDMEDAMIINKSSFERGFAHGSVFKTQLIDLKEDVEAGDWGGLHGRLRWFSNMAVNENDVPMGAGEVSMEEVVKAEADDIEGDVKEGADEDYVEELSEDNLLNLDLDFDGLPRVGTKLETNDPYYSYWDNREKTHTIVRYKGKETAYVEQVFIVGYGSNAHQQSEELNIRRKVSIKLRLIRRPTRGDKFSSRHGQKGVLSRLWPQCDMPFSESGMTPDVIINPHAFPSRMTIGMLIESMAGKSAALYGVKKDSDPFQYSEKNTPLDHFGRELAAKGYNYYGNESFYSGITGEEFRADIFFGVVYYQRLRHLVLDKYQVRSTGPRNPLTRQPVKGRKRGGGIRFGEMERDSMLAHGTSFLIRDRLLNCSDASVAHICIKCGSLISPLALQKMKLNSDGKSRKAYYRKKEMVCYFCNSEFKSTTSNEISFGYIDSGKRSPIAQVIMPYVTRYLVNELAAMNIRLTFDVEEIK